MAAKKTPKKAATKKTPKQAATKKAPKKAATKKASTKSGGATKAKSAEPKRKAAAPAKKKTAAAATKKATSGKKSTKTAAGGDAAASEPRAKGTISSTAVNMGNVFALRPRVNSSFRQEHFLNARRLLDDQAYETIEEATRAVVERALELSNEPKARRGPKRGR